jgi:ubiquinone/menaquinone biosynthesis C-methylase UbiE
LPARCGTIANVGERLAVTGPKEQVQEFWDAASCGESLYLSGADRDSYEAQSRQRYTLEPYIPEFARFDDARGKRVLEIGVGLGADHERFAQAGADLYGIDLTRRAVEHTRRRLAIAGLSSTLDVGDAENLPFPNAFFDRVYSWGVLHHSPSTSSAVAEVRRVLKPGGVARVMIYHKWSIVGGMLWVRYALLRLRPWTSLDAVYDQYLESPGTKAFSTRGARKLFAQFSDVRMRVVLTHADLLESRAGQQHEGELLSLARRLWPRNILKRFAGRFGLFLLIEARK